MKILLSKLNFLLSALSSEDFKIFMSKTIILLLVNGLLLINCILILKIGDQWNGRGSGIWCQWGCTIEHQISCDPAFLHCDFFRPHAKHLYSGDEHDNTVYKRTVWVIIMYGSSNFGGNRGPRDFGPREMTKVVCSDCGKECEVPFKPTEGRPVYCRDCLPKHRKPRF